MAVAEALEKWASALAAMKGDKTLAELAQQYDILPSQIAEWKTQLPGPVLNQSIYGMPYAIWSE